jgi:hypothetical protein
MVCQNLRRGHYELATDVAPPLRLAAGGRGVPPLAQEYVDDLPVLVDRPVQVPPPAGDLDVGLVDEPAVPRWHAGAGGRRRRTAGEPLHPPIHRHVVHGDAAFGQQLLYIPLREAVAQVPADRDTDHLGWEPEPGEGRPVDVRASGGARSTHRPSFLSQLRPSPPGLGECNRPG